MCGGAGELASGEAPGGAAGLYNPYGGLTGGAGGGARGARGLHFPKAPELLFHEEATVRRKTWSESLTFCTGAGYLGGTAVGGMIGAAQGLRGPGPELPGGVAKLRLNFLLNKTASHGKGFGNALGTLGLLYAGLDSLINYGTEDRLGDEANSTCAAAAAAAVYRSGAGPRSAAIGAAVGGAFAAAVHGAQYAWKQIN